MTHTHVKQACTPQRCTAEVQTAAHTETYKSTTPKQKKNVDGYSSRMTKFCLFIDLISEDTQMMGGNISCNTKTGENIKTAAETTAE